jgi:deferrochelatase/peroxidase EfeB
MSALDEPILATHDIQGDVLPGFRKTYQEFLFAQVAAPEAARRALRELPEVTTTDTVLGSHSVWKQMYRTTGRRPVFEETWLNLAFTWAGLRALQPGLADEQTFRQHRSFLQPAVDLEHLLGSSASWMVGGRRSAEPHMLVNLSSDDAAHLAASVAHVERVLTADGGWTIGFRQSGERQVDPNGHAVEHFGFRDGISTVGVRGIRPGGGFVTPRTNETQHVVLSTTLVLKPTRWTKKGQAGRTGGTEDEPKTVAVPFASPGVPLVWPGQFVLGSDYPKQSDFDADGRPARPDSFLENGSFLVWLRLRQHVDRFWAAARQHAETLTSFLGRPVDVEAAAALLVGRHRDGTPLIFRPVLGQAPAWDPENGPLPDEALNHFAYRTPTPPATGLDEKTMLPEVPSDPAGQVGGPVCPLGAHMRKMNPRVTPALSKAILRRSITYGTAIDVPRPATSDDAGRDQEREDRGLCFVCYQSDIKEQFATLQGGMASTSGVPDDESPVDLMSGLGALRGGPVKLVTPRPGRGGSVPELIETRWVEMTGGSYFFVPSLSNLERLMADDVTPRRGRGRTGGRRGRA